MLCACRPGTFDKFVGESRATDAGGVDSGVDAAVVTPAPDAGRGTGGSAGGNRDAGGSGRDAAAGSGAAGTSGSGAADTGADAEPLDGGADAGAAIDSGSSDAGSETPCLRADDPSSVRLSPSDLGVMPTPAWVSSRYVERSVAVDDRVLWLFGMSEHRSMAAWSEIEAAPAAPPQLDEQMPLVPLLPAAASPNADPVNVTAVVAADDRVALIFFAYSPFLQPIQVGLARIERDQRQAQVVRALGSFFVYSAAPFRPAFGTAPVIEQTATGTFLYLYSCNPHPDLPEESIGGILDRPCRVARVPLGDVADPALYRYWNGLDWGTDAASAVVVIRGVPGGFSVSFNRYLEKYLAVHSGSSNNLILRWADRPQGPWHSLGAVDTLPGGGALGISLYGTEHAALRDACEQVVYLSYVRDFLDNAGMQIAPSETRLVRVQLE